MLIEKTEGTADSNRYWNQDRPTRFTIDLAIYPTVEIITLLSNFSISTLNTTNGLASAK